MKTADDLGGEIILKVGFQPLKILSPTVSWGGGGAKDARAKTVDLLRSSTKNIKAIQNKTILNNITCTMKRETTSYTVTIGVERAPK